jgi:hypothetical protein
MTKQRPGVQRGDYRILAQMKVGRLLTPPEIRIVDRLRREGKHWKEAAEEIIAEAERRVNARPRRPVDPDGYTAMFDPDGVTLRPLRTRRPDAQIYATWDQIYKWALIARVTPSKRRAK